MPILDDPQAEAFARDRAGREEDETIQLLRRTAPLPGEMVAAGLEEDETVRLLRRIAPLPGETADSTPLSPLGAVRPERSSLTAQGRADSGSNCAPDEPRRALDEQDCAGLCLDEQDCAELEPSSGPPRARSEFVNRLGIYAVCEASFSPPLNNPKREAFAQALAEGLSVDAAARKAGFKYVRHGRRIVHHRDIVERVAARRAAHLGGGSRDVAGLIDTLIATAAEARRLNTAQGLATARAAYETVAKLKAQLPEPPLRFIDPDRVAPDDERELTPAEWQRKHGKPAPGEGA